MIKLNHELYVHILLGVIKFVSRLSRPYRLSDKPVF